ncbi:hypothetical protein K466DRAFT_570511 [Polyporus arcularius HHB13444]|uniref:Uncharacterized protein n=1 Tax=Polyporus arcularius HHB13444 TaxID=1314778 RepID=A0A5C3NNB0_9APHY|nr:hypothetical protein K466DRAFT_570511 [Polyporus arcularius HHB13444]
MDTFTPPLHPSSQEGLTPSATQGPHPAPGKPTSNYLRYSYDWSLSSESHSFQPASSRLPVSTTDAQPTLVTSHGRQDTILVVNLTCLRVDSLLVVSRTSCFHAASFDGLQFAGVRQCRKRAAKTYAGGSKEYRRQLPRGHTSITDQRPDQTRWLPLVWASRASEVFSPVPSRRESGRKMRASPKDTSETVRKAPTAALLFQTRPTPKQPGDQPSDKTQDGSRQPSLVLQCTTNPDKYMRTFSPGILADTADAPECLAAHAQSLCRHQVRPRRRKDGAESSDDRWDRLQPTSGAAEGGRMGGGGSGMAVDLKKTRRDNRRSYLDRRPESPVPPSAVLHYSVHLSLCQNGVISTRLGTQSASVELERVVCSVDICSLAAAPAHMADTAVSAEMAAADRGYGALAVVDCKHGFLQLLVPCKSKCSSRAFRPASAQIFKVACPAASNGTPRARHFSMMRSEAVETR